MPIQEYNNIFYPNGFNSTLEEYEKKFVKVINKHMQKIKLLKQITKNITLVY